MARLMSGVRTTGQLHFGNYFGAIKTWVELQNQYECFFGAMDWHGMTSNYKNSSEVMPWNRDIIAELLAWGIDPEKNVLFIQSFVPEHLELFLIFANLTPMGWLERVPTWKDAEEENKANDTHNLGRFAYPVLQAADIAIYQAQKVPVGQDQVAHLELSREIIRRFNHLYKAQLPEPQPVLTKMPVVTGLDGRKMSKSYGNTLLMTEDEKSLLKKVRAMPTDPQRVRREDPGDPDQCNVYTFHKLFSTEKDLEWVNVGCRSAGIGCGDCKGRLAENINSLCAEPREKKKQLLNQPERLDSIIRDGCERARKEAQLTLRMVKERMKL
ncbi:MAG: tryptophan--tRNA ligase [Bdellovibrio sp. CG10_big_fil_rev_8_21_14_0_10_47_8]|nr:MAG: tryptophan--tRNA ligase [Bdellovibrio sp. CG10_big_fil_rev_8_21_14_0_10_47_8]